MFVFTQVNYAGVRFFGELHITPCPKMITYKSKIQTCHVIFIFKDLIKEAEEYCASYWSLSQAYPKWKHHFKFKVGMWSY